MKQSYHLKKIYLFKIYYLFKKNYSKLNLEDISDKDYEHAQKLFKEYCKNMSDYHELYVQTDTLLLADAFENFRNKCYEIYDIDPSYFYSASGLGWQACLKKTKVKLELLTDKLLTDY